MTADLKWPAQDDSLQRSRFDLQSRKRLIAPQAPGDLAAADSGSEGVTVSWGIAQPFTQVYQIERTPAFPSPVLVAAGNGTYNDPSGPGIFKYRARAINPAGASPYGDWATATVLVRPPQVPTNVTATNLGDGSAQVGWTDNSSSETRFEVQRSPAFPLGVAVPANMTGYTDLCGPGTFFYRVRAVNNAGPSPYSGWAQVQVIAPVPTAPSNLAVTDQFNATSKLTWSDNSNNETGFQIQRNPSFPSGLVAVGAGATSYVDVCGPGSFSYRVRAANTAGGSSFTPWVQVNVVTPGLAVPTNVRAEDTHTRRALVQWTDTSSTETGFEIQRSPAFSGTVQVGAGVTAYVDQCGVGTFNYRVRTLGPGGPSAFSPWASVQVANTEPSAPTGLTLQDMGNQVNIRVAWVDTSDNETSFKIQREQQVSGNWVSTTNLAAAANATSYQDNPGTGTYRYRVCASNSVGDSAFTGWVGLTVGTGWTIFTPSADTRIVYVSSSGGNDNNTGLSEAAPKRTLAAAKGLLRNGMPDWILLKRGDTWTEGFGNWTVSGRSASEPTVVGSYGSSSVRPLILSGTTNGLHQVGGATIRHFAIAGIHFRAARTGNEEAYGIRWVDPAENLLIEDCKFEGYTTNMVFDGFGGTINGIRIRRCVVVDAFSTNSHSQGVYADSVNNLVIEESVFDHNGWKEGVAAPDMFNHNIYIQTNCGPAVVRGNILARAASHGAQIRPGGVMVNNLFIQNSMAGFVAASVSVVTDNVVLHGKDIDPQSPRGSGLEVLINTPPGSTVRNNLMAHRDATGFNGFALRVACRVADVEDNVIYNWSSTNEPAILFNEIPFSGYQSMRVRGNRVVLASINGYPVSFSEGSFQAGVVQFSNNRYYSARPNEWFRLGSGSYTLGSWGALTGDSGAPYPASQFPDPSRDLPRYNQEQGGASTLEDFLARASLQGKQNWNAAYTAAVVNAWMRAGFAMSQP